MTDRSPLFQPVKLGDLELPNRVLMAPLTRNRSEDDGTPVTMAETYYSQRASAGLILTEAAQVSAMGKGYIKTPGIYEPPQLNWSTTMFRKRRTENGKQATQARRDCL
ncbi:N-ethylmaleimide reductase, partial [Lutimaribacter saemankumensis]